MNEQYIKEDTLKKAVEMSEFFNSSFLIEKADSSNDLAKEFIENKKLESGIILVNKQMKGRGRQNKTWISNFGACLTFTLIFKAEDIKLNHLSSLIVAKAVHKALMEVNEIKDSESGLYIKWPNDIIAGNKKISGILCENIFEGNKLKNQIIGIGLNFGEIQADNADLKDAGSIKSVYGFDIDVNDLFLNIIKSIDSVFKEDSFDFNYINKYSYLNQKRILCTIDGKDEKATVIQVDLDGNLILRLDNNVVHKLSSGTIILL